MPNSTISPQALKKLILTYLIPLPLIGFILLLIGEHNLRSELQHVSRSYVHQIEEVIDELRDENYQALYDATTCQQIQKDLLFEAFLREMLIVEDNQITCSSKVIQTELSQNKHPIPEAFQKTGEYLFEIPGESGPVLSLLAVDTDKNNPKRSAVSIIDQSYLDLRIGIKNDDRIKQSVMNVSGKHYPPDIQIESDRFLTSAHSDHLNIEIALTPSNKIKNSLYIKTLLITLSSSIFLSVFWHLIQFWYKTKDSLAEKIKKGLKNNEFFLVYQPLVKSTTRQVEGVEALIRWQSPTKDNIGPDVFIPVAEQQGLIDHITDFVLEKALADWSIYPNQSLHISINVPPSYLSQKGCLDKLRTLAERYKEKGLELGLEITERQLLTPPDRAVLFDIQKLGIHVSIDDFGTGYTSLSVLQDTKFNYLKIDRCFINTIGIESVNSAVLSSIIKLAKSMEVQMVAEGVETKEQADYLKEHGVQLLQGFYLYRPMRVGDLYSILQQQNSEYKE